MFLASGPGNRVHGALFHFMCHNRNGYQTGASWNGNLLPRILKRPLKSDKNPPACGQNKSSLCVPTRKSHQNWRLEIRILMSVGGSLIWLRLFVMTLAPMNIDPAWEDVEDRN